MAEDAVDEDEEQGSRGVAGDRPPERDENGERTRLPVWKRY